MPLYGQVVVGPPGSGKTTYCNGMQQYLRLLGRNAWVVNLDPANEAIQQYNRQRCHEPDDDDDDVTRTDDDKSHNTASTVLPYETIFDLCHEFVNLSSVQEKMGLGPNGGLVYCMEYLEEHADEMVALLKERVDNAASEHYTSINNGDGNTTQQKVYLIFDLPGQVELYTHSTCVQNLLQKLMVALDLRLTMVQLIDAQYCTDASKFLSAALLGTTTMLRLELPAVNVLSKVDLLAQYGDSLPMHLQYFAECHDLERLVQFLLDDPSVQREEEDANDDEFDAIQQDPVYQRARAKRQQSKIYQKFKKLHQAIAEVVEDYGLLSFLLLDITQAESVGRVVAEVDKCNGYVYTQPSINQDLFQCAIQADSKNTYESIADIQERVLTKHPPDMKTDRNVSTNTEKRSSK